MVGGFEGFAPVGSGGGDEHDRLAGGDLAGTVHDQHVLKGKTRRRRLGHAGDLDVGEAGIGFQHQALDGALARSGEAGEADDGAGFIAATAEGPEQGARIKGFGLQANLHVSPRSWGA